MKTKHYLLFSIALLLLFEVSLNAKDSYYYYNGNKIPLQLRDDSVNVYTRTSNTMRMKTGEDFDRESVTSVEYIVIGTENKSIKMSNKFYVQLFDSITDMPKLQAVAKETKTTIVGKVPHTPNWYELLVSNSIINNSLEMSNYFYETGLFKNIDPGFILDFRPLSECVSDSHFASHQWNMSAINACDAWTITKGSSNIKIAIIDSGIDRRQVEFPYNHFVHWYDCDTETQEGYRAYTVHGTWVCGVITANHNDKKIAGLAPNCNIIPISSYLTESNESLGVRLASGFSWAVTHGADIINCSWGSANVDSHLHSTILEDAIQNALTNGRDGKGCVVVFAAGNDNSTQLAYPGSFLPDLITVGAMKNNLTKREDSSYGAALDLVAPGDNVYTTDLDSDYAYISQTSIAAPHVSGIAGLMLSINPYLSRKEVTDIIESTARKVPSETYYQYENTIGRPNGKWSFEMGYGLVDAYAAVTKAKDFQIRGPEKISVSATYSLVRPSQPGETVSWSIYNGEMYNPFFYIVGPTNLDSVVVQYNDVVLSSNNDGSRGLIDIPDRPFPMDSSLINNQKYLSVTITSANGSKTYTKPLYIERNNKPTITVSDTALLWRANSTRVFNITNCANVSDSLLRWTVARYSQAAATPQISNYYGRTLTYTPSAPPRISMDSLTVYATNLTDNIGNGQSKILRFIIFRPIHIITSIENDILNVSLVEDEVNQTAQRAEQLLDPNKNYTIELWHSMYGKQYAGNMRNSKEQINISGLPSGTYVLLLKDGNSVATQTKVLIQ